ncbi:MAG: hypothetical protein ACO3JL_10880, partial [Myxococcota bacterium]
DGGRVWQQTLRQNEPGAQLDEYRLCLTREDCRSVDVHVGPRHCGNPDMEREGRLPGEGTRMDGARLTRALVRNRSGVRQ